MKITSPKKIILFLFLLSISISVNSQILQKSTISMAGATAKIQIGNANYNIIQSVGQQSVIGTFSKNNIEIRQGFVQSPLLNMLFTDTNMNLTMSLFPNPAIKTINLLTNSGEVDLNYSIFNVAGKLMAYGKVQKLKSVIDVSFLKSGIYFLSIKNSLQNQSFMFLKK
ncbi:MAG: T9SS type A sorting domain-containing protein [Lutibacter sp.]